MKINDVIDRYAELKIEINTRLLLDEDGSVLNTLLIEGNKISLLFLADVLRAIAEESEEEDFFIDPYGAGKAHFSKSAEMGIYINKICDLDD